MDQLSHVDEEVNTKVIKTIAEHFGNLRVSKGKKHKFLGIDIEFLADVKLSLLMKYCIEESIDLFREELTPKLSSPEKTSMHNIDESPTRLENKDADILRSIVAKLLWVEKGGRPEIMPVVSFL